MGLFNQPQPNQPKLLAPTQPNKNQPKHCCRVGTQLPPPKALVKTSPWVAILGIGHPVGFFLLPPSGKKWRNFMCFSNVHDLEKFNMWIVLGWVVFWSGYLCYFLLLPIFFVQQIMHTCVRFFCLTTVVSSNHLKRNRSHFFHGIFMGVLCLCAVLRWWQ